MKLSDIENAKKAHKMIVSLEKNITKLKSQLAEEPRPDVGGIEGVFEYGHGCRVGRNSDGSGFNVDMSGCYVAYQVYKATLNVLIEQRDNVIAYLTSINVEVDETEI